MAAKEEIISGLKIAIERGESLQTAVQSFMNAGYSPEEVLQASHEVNLGITKKLNLGEVQAESQQENYINQENSSKKQKSKRLLWKIIIFVLIFIILMAILGIILFFV